MTRSPAPLRWVLRRRPDPLTAAFVAALVEAFPVTMSPAHPHDTQHFPDALWLARLSVAVRRRRATVAGGLMAVLSLAMSGAAMAGGRLVLAWLFMLPALTGVLLVLRWMRLSVRRYDEMRLVGSRQLRGSAWRSVPAQWLTINLFADCGLPARTAEALAGTRERTVTTIALLDNEFSGTVADLLAAVTAVTSAPHSAVPTPG